MSEFSKEIQISIEVAAELFTNLIAKTYQGVAGFVKDKNKEHDFFGTATKKYVGGLIGRYNLVKVPGMREPVPLKGLYVRANILEKISARTRLRPEELTEFSDFDRRVFGKKTETVDGEHIVNRLDKFVLLGKSGGGKTTYLKYLALMMLDSYSQIERRRLPIFVTLRSWADESVPLIDFIIQQFDICGFEESKTFVERMLKNGDCLVLLDGLDEVSEIAKRYDIIRQIRSFTDKYSHNQFVISCWVATYTHRFDQFTDVEMADFNVEQIETFIRNWFHGEPKVATECWERLKNSPPLRELASVPLLLTLLCLEYGESNDFPPNRAELYDRAIETLLAKWDSSRRIRRDNMYQQLSFKRKESLLARIAFGTFSENEYFFRERSLAKMIENYIKNLPGFNPAEHEADSLSVLQDIASQGNIIVERAKGVFSFAHLTFQEYFTAKYIMDNQLSGSLEKLVEERLYDSKWKEVFLLTAGLLDNADELLLLMRRKANEALEIPEVNDLMDAAKKSLLPVEGKYPMVVRRNTATSIALSISLTYAQTSLFTNVLDQAGHLERGKNGIGVAVSRDRAYALGFGHDFEFSSELVLAFEYAHENARVLSNILGPELDFSMEFDYDHGFNLDVGFNLDLSPLEPYGEANKLNEQVILKIQDYFSANTLIVNCLEAANYVSKDVREKMLHEICLPKRG